MNPMLAPPGRAQVSRRTTSGLQIGWARAAGNRTGAEAENVTTGTPGGNNAAGAAATQVPPEQPRGPQLSEQLDLLDEVLNLRRLADLERRGLFLRPEVF